MTLEKKKTDDQLSDKLLLMIFIEYNALDKNPIVAWKTGLSGNRPNNEGDLGPVWHGTITKIVTVIPEFNGVELYISSWKAKEMPVLLLFKIRHDSHIKPNPIIFYSFFSKLWNMMPFSYLYINLTLPKHFTYFTWIRWFKEPKSL